MPNRPAFAFAALAAAVSAMPAAAATPQETQASAFVQKLADETFGVLRDGARADTDRQTRFRAMLRDNFAIQVIGDRLIRRHRATLTPQQYQAYTAAFPTFVVGTYADRLEAYRDARFQVVRTLDRGRLGVDVVSRVTSPGARQPIEAVWNVRPGAGGRMQITNLTVGGINLALTQEADFTAYIERNGFDALVTFMRGQGRA